MSHARVRRRGISGCASRTAAVGTPSPGARYCVSGNVNVVFSHAATKPLKPRWRLVRTSPLHLKFMLSGTSDVPSLTLKIFKRRVCPFSPSFLPAGPPPSDCPVAARASTSTVLRARRLPQLPPTRPTVLTLGPRPSPFFCGCRPPPVRHTPALAQLTITTPRAVARAVAIAPAHCSFRRPLSCSRQRSPPLRIICV